MQYDDDPSARKGFAGHFAQAMADGLTWLLAYVIAAVAVVGGVALYFGVSFGTALAGLAVVIAGVVIFWAWLTQT